ncbi:MAG: plasmid recombination protein [Candidatus Gastranaerophilales bacterium]|nr:plasmid recombination protein [Candidatus Gastranaerophilales bacterium]
MAKMRMTSHNGRWGRVGAYSTKHNDRQFNVEEEPHINSNKSIDNLYWNCYEGFNKDEKGNTKNQIMSFDECEKKFYEENFDDFLKYRNQRYIERRQYKNIWTADDYRKRKNSCPEETIFQIGKQGETIDGEILKNVFLNFKKWHEEKFPQIKILNFALHLDEENPPDVQGVESRTEKKEKVTPHIHFRRVWVAQDDDGKKYVSQNKVLEKLCIKKPNEEKETHRWNNPKQTFTAICREKFLKLCEEYGLEIEKEPQESSKVGLDMATYQRQQEEEKIKKLQEEIEKMNMEIRYLNEEIKDGNDILDEMEDDLQNIVAAVDAFKDQWLNARQNKNDYEELRIVRDFVRWYNPDGRKELEYFFKEVPKIIERSKAKKEKKYNNRGRGRAR